MRLKNSSGLAVATAAAMLFGTSLISTAVAGTDAKTQCAGVNACKGKGFLEMSKQECAAAKEKMKSDSK